MKKNNLRKLMCIVNFALCISLTGCYSVFTGGTGGTIVDAESTSNPKTGIANVDVYAYTTEKDRNADFDAWTEGSTFKPAAEYYGHTTTGSSGTFSLSKIVWKAYTPTFGKDADVQQIYLLFYHENYGLVKGETLIVSDSTADTVYQELTKIRKTTVLNISMIDVANDATTSENVYVKVSVPQTTSTNTSATAKVYDATITGTGVITVSYPRWQSEDEKSAGNETNPEVTISYYQSADEITWKGCWNGDGPNAYDFYSDGFTVKKTINNDSYDVKLYGKKTKLSVPKFNGHWGNTESDDGVTLTLLYSVDNSFTSTKDCGQTTTYSQTVGTSGTKEHGVFSDLGSGSSIIITDYKDKFARMFFRVTDGVTNVDKEVRSNDSTVNIQK